MIEWIDSFSESLAEAAAVHNYAMTMRGRVLTATFLAVCTATMRASEPAIRLLYTRGVPQVEFSVREFRAAAAARHRLVVEGTISSVSQPRRPGVTVAIMASDPESKLAPNFGLPVVAPHPPQGYSIRRRVEHSQTTYVVLASDPTGAMYGCLDVAEAVRLGTLSALDDSDHVAFITNRGIKFNIPLDARTPSYSDAGDSAQQNIPQVWDIHFWHDFLDELARHRYNLLSLWNLHPFPSMVKVPEYPDVALDDVMRTTQKFDSSYSLTGSDMVRPSQLQHLELIKRMTIQQKIEFWREVMQYAHDRGITVYLFTWNIFVWGTEGKHGITSAQDNPVTIDYFRRSVAATLRTYPLLAGIGVTAGEHMEDRRDGFSKERWLLDTYGQAMLDVEKEQPDRKLLLIHRMNQANLKDILAEWSSYPGPFQLSYKYAVAHMYSVLHPPFAARDLAEMPAGMKTWMTLRNDDIYSFRWGDPGFVRAYLQGLPGPSVLAGFYMGPDGYTWGREFISTEPEAPRQLVITKQWYSFMLWGRLAYDPTLPDTLFQRTLAVRYPEVPSATLFSAFESASKVIPDINRFFWAGGGNDLAWFPEACTSHPGHHGFYTVEDFIHGATTPGSGNMNVQDYVDAVMHHKPMTGTTPLEVSRQLREHSTSTLALLDKMPGAGGDKELRLTVGDLRAMAYLGLYYSDKIAAAVDLAMYRAGGPPATRESAVNELTTAVEDWRKYAGVATSQYKPQLLTRIGYVDLDLLTRDVENDVTIAGR